MPIQAFAAANLNREYLAVSTATLSTLVYRRPSSRDVSDVHWIGWVPFSSCEITVSFTFLKLGLSGTRDLGAFRHSLNVSSHISVTASSRVVSSLLEKNQAIEMDVYVQALEN